MASAQDGDGAVADDAGSLEAVHAGYLEDQELQLEWPEAEPPAAREPTPGWLAAIARFFGNVFSALGPFLQVAFYALCGLAVGAIALFVGRSLLGSRFGAANRKRSSDIEESVAEPYRPDAVVARSLLEEADALAAAGRFAEAVHLLLFRSIEDIQTRRDGGVPKSLTAREIARLDALPDRAKTGLSPIIALVERSFFGGRAVDREGWQSARASYEDFAFGESWA